MRWVVAAMAAMIGFTGEAAAQAAEPVQVMVLGTYHFDSPGLDIHNPKIDDVLKPQRQRELDAIAAAMTEFRPTKIMLERQSPDLIDPKYAAFAPAALLKQRDERVQIGHRIARRLGHSTVYAIDEQSGIGEPDYFPFGKVVEWANANGAKDRLETMMANGAAEARKTEQLQSETIPRALAELNRPETIERNQALYYEALQFGDFEQQPGADLNAMWYLRNAKIFSKLMKVAAPGDRVLVVYGAGHNYWLRHFAKTVNGYRNVDPLLYLEKAAAALR